MQTLSKKDQARDKHLQKTYLWTLEQRNSLSLLQGHKCAICGRPETDKMPLNMDHYHYKVKAHKMGGRGSLWFAYTTINGIQYDALASTKLKAIEACHQKALPHSVRGLLCPGRQWGCNRRLGRVDNIKWLTAALEYLLDPPARKIRA